MKTKGSLHWHQRLWPQIALDMGVTHWRALVVGANRSVEVMPCILLDTAGKVVAYGEAAANVGARLGERGRLIWPLQEPSADSARLAQQLLSHLLSEAAGGQWLGAPALALACNAGDEANTAQLVKLAWRAGARQVLVIDALLAAALGCGVRVWEEKGNCVILAGSSLVSVGFVVLGGSAHVLSSPVAGQAVLGKVQQVLREDHRLIIDQAEASRILETVWEDQEHPTVKIRGKLTSGRPSEQEILLLPLLAKVESLYEEHAQLVLKVFAQSPASLVSDAAQRGIILTGGMAVWPSYRQFLASVLQLPIVEVDEPRRAVLHGVAAALEFKEFFEPAPVRQS